MQNKTELKQIRSESLAKIMKAFLDDTVVLTKHEQKMYDRLVYADELLKDVAYPSNEQRAKTIAKQFNISLQSARNDILQAIEFFSSFENIDTRVAVKIILHQIDHLYNFLCKSERYILEYPKEIIKLIELRIKTIEKLVGDVQIDPRLLQQNNFTFNMGDQAGKLLNLEKIPSRSELKKFLSSFDIPTDKQEQIIQEAEIEE